MLIIINLIKTGFGWFYFDYVTILSVIIILSNHSVVSFTSTSCLVFMAMKIFHGFDGFVVMICMVFGSFCGFDALVLGGSIPFLPIFSFHG